MKTFLTRSLVALLIFHHSGAAAQTREILAITGASTIEELDESEIERFESLSANPIDINTASRSRLTASGLFSPLQTASICEYRSRCGPVRSITELGTLDGFTPGSARMTAPFITFNTTVPEGPVPEGTRHELQSRVAARKDKGNPVQMNYGIKYKAETGGRATLTGAFRTSYGNGPKPDTWSFSAAWYGQRRLGKIVIGDYNARFGQGMALWSGWSLSGLGSAEAASKKPTGISPSWSYSPTGNLRGIAADFNFGRFTFSAMTAVPGLRQRMDGDRDATGILLPAANLSWLGRKSQISATAIYGTDGTAAVSADFRWSPGRAMLFGEAGYDISGKTPAAVGGVIWSPAYQYKVSILARCYPSRYEAGYSGAMRAGSKCSDETGASLGVTLPRLRLTADACIQPGRGKRQLKLIAQAPLTAGRFSITPRISTRIRNGDSRTEARLDGEWTGGDFMAHCRADAVRCKALSWLGYAECGYKTEKVWAYLRGGIFKVDEWDDRIYVYERDAPGSFNVPAYYGRGINASLTAGIKMPHSRLYLRMGHMNYLNPKPDRLECKLQWTLRL